MSKVFSEEDVALHNKQEDCWVIIGNDSNGGAKVYDVTKYLNDHPGGPEIILELAGKNADEMFEDIGHSKEARSKMKEYLIGDAKVTSSGKAGSKTAADVKSKGGLNPLAVLVLLIAIALGVYFTQKK